MSLAVASACAAFAPAYAQVAAADAAVPETQTVVVTGLRASMQSTLALKKNADGIVDGIVAADIGKFPDTNLAESLQRISGVSIDRQMGEGSKVTVRGVGPDFNMVLLNGRQMPTSNLGDLNGRAFDFANIASEAISQIQVYKTSRADSPPGGIGATLNVMTARPFDSKGTQASVGIKAVYDTSANNLPGAIKPDSALAPEMSGIYSTVFGDGKFGVSISASYQARSLGYNDASVSSGWRGPYTGDQAGDWGTLPKPGEAGFANHINRPGPTDTYSVPQNMSYQMTGAERQRTNGQLTFQFRPVNELTTTLDYTYSQNKVQTKRASMGAWFNMGPSFSEYTDGPLASPIKYGEFNTGQDIAMNGADFATKSINNSIGFNAVWKASADLRLELDAHHSTAESKADSPYGSVNTIATSSFSRNNSFVDFSNEMPVLGIEGADFVKSPQQVTGSWFQNGYMKMETDQIQAKGALHLLEASNLKFGVASTKTQYRASFSNVQQDTWSGASKASDYPASLFHHEPLSQYYDNMGGSNDPRLYNNLSTFDFETVRAAAAAATGKPNRYLPNFTSPDTDQRTTEKSQSLYVSFGTDWDTAMPMHTQIGVRAEKTKVVSSALVQTGKAIRWVSQNELPLTFSGRDFSSAEGKYTSILPSADMDIDVRPDVKARASYGETIGRPRYDQISGGTVLGTGASVIGGTGTSGNPALKPVKSKNLDLSLEWYFGKQSVASIGLFKKKLNNYAGPAIIDDNSFGLHTPIGGALFKEAMAKAGCLVTDTQCIRDYIFINHPTAPGVTRTPDANGDTQGTIVGQPGDPLANFRVTTFVNSRSDKLKGLEFNLQHMFGTSGFGVQTNYTIVKSGLQYDNFKGGNQFVLLGLSDSANFVGIYENANWSVRAAYNWRDEFLAAVQDGQGNNNPVYTMPYGQWDLSVGYNFDKNLSFQFEAINLTDQIYKQRSRTEMQKIQLTQSGPRYMLSARYKF